MKPSNPSSVRFRKIALSVAVLLGFACGPSFDPNEFMSFFQPESATMLPGDRGFVFSPQLYADNEWVGAEEDTLVLDENVRAWVAYAGGKLSETEVSKALYNEEAPSVARLTKTLAGTKAPAVSYLKFAWSADDGQANPWATDAAPVDSARLPKLLEEAKAGYTTTSDAFLKERYAFQAVKLACERADYRQAVQLYDQLVGPLRTKTFMSDWALCRRAGATLALGDTARAIYEFAQVFDRCPSRRRAAETSLRKNRITFRDEALQFAKTDRERAAVYALCAIQPGQDALELLKALVHLSPKNPLVELVMAREINRNEYYFFMDGPQYMHSTSSSEPDSLGFVGRRAESVSYFDKLRSFALESAGNKALGNGAFWYTATAYLDYIGKEYKEAQTHLDQAAQLPTSNPNLKKQIALQRMLLLAAQTSAMTPEVENQLIGYLVTFDTTQSFRLNNAFVATCKQFAAIYQQKAESNKGWFSSCTRSKAPEVDGPGQAKAYLLTMLTTQGHGDFSSIADPIAIEDSIPSATVKNTLAFASQANPTDFDKRLLKLSGLTTDYLNLLLGRRLMMEHQYAEAAEVFAQVDPKTWKNDAFSTFFTRNPFAIKMPRLQGKGLNLPAESTQNPYTPVTFARRMAELEQQAKAASGDKAAEFYYLLGCGAWNMSWYGNAWLVTKSFWSGGEPPVYDTPTDPTQKQKRFDELMKTDYYTTTTARTYFGKSAKSAKTPSLADRSAYMAARCEANAFSLQKSIEQVRNGYVYEEDSTFVKKMLGLRKTSYARYYNDFFNNHRHSPFNQEMIRECAMYKDFLSFGETSEN